METEMDEILERFEQIRAYPARSIPADAAATLVLAGVLRDSLSQLPIELRCELARYLAEQIPVRS